MTSTAATTAATNTNTTTIPKAAPASASAPITEAATAFAPTATEHTHTHLSACLIQWSLNCLEKAQLSTAPDASPQTPSQTTIATLQISEQQLQQKNTNNHKRENTQPPFLPFSPKKKSKQAAAVCSLQPPPQQHQQQKTVVAAAKHTPATAISTHVLVGGSADASPKRTREDYFFTWFWFVCFFFLPWGTTKCDPRHPGDKDTGTSKKQGTKTL